MPEDFQLFLVCSAIGLSVGLIAGLVLKFGFPRFESHLVALKRSQRRKWWHFACYATFFAAMALLETSQRWWCSAALFAILTFAELITMVRLLWQPDARAPAVQLEDETNKLSRGSFLTWMTVGVVLIMVAALAGFLVGFAEMPRVGAPFGP